MPILKLDGDAQGAVKAVSAVTEEEKQLTTEIQKSTKAGEERHNKFAGWAKDEKKFRQEAIRESKQLEQAAQQIVLANEGPQERYNRQLWELTKLYNKGKLSADEMQRATARYRFELEQSTVVQSTAFGSGALQAATSYFLGLFGPGALVAGAIGMLRQYGSELDGIGTQMQSGRAGWSLLLQMAANAPNPQQKMKGYRGEAYGIWKSGATGTLGEAADLLGTLESANITDPKQRKLITDMLASGVLPEAKQFTASIAALRSSYPDLPVDKLVGMGIVAAIPSPGGAEQIIQHAGKSGAQLKALGWSPEFGLAATSILSRQYGGASEGGVRLEQFMKQVEHYGYQTDPTLKGMDPFQTIERIQAVTHGDEHELVKYIGNRMEAKQGFRSLRDNEAELKNLTAMAGGTNADLAYRALDLAHDTPEIETARAAVASKNSLDASRTPDEMRRMLLESLQADAKQGRGAISSGMINSEFWIDKNMKTSAGQDAELRAMYESAKSGDLWFKPTDSTMESLGRYLQSIDNKTPNAPPPSGRQEK